MVNKAYENSLIKEDEIESDDLEEIVPDLSWPSCTTDKD